MAEAMKQGVDKNINDPGKAFGETPGAALREIRLKKGVSADEVRKQLGLTVSLFEALEADDHQRLPSPVFVKGYLRRYSELMSLRPAATLAAYQKYLEDHDLIPRPETQVQDAERPVFAMVASALGLLLATSLVFGAILNDSKPAGENESRQSLALSKLAPSATKKTEEQHLELDFMTDSWVEVVDGRDHILEVSLQRAGSHLDLKGQPPFQVKLGYGPGVAVTYQDKKIAFEPDPQTQAVDLLLGSTYSK